jgi:dihydrofolate reductase
MSRVVVKSFGVSLDGFAAGPQQSVDNPLGLRGPELMDWFFHTRVWQAMHGNPDQGQTGVDDDVAAQGFAGIGAWILGRNMFAPSRGEWPDDNWKGWWGPNPPYHVPTFILTHHKRAPIEMEGGTTFYFVADGIQSALKQAKAVAGDKDVRVGGGVSTVRQYLQEKLIDEMHLVVSPLLLGSGEHLFAGLDMLKLGYRCTGQVATADATHVMIGRV